jgi:hypothetical protein
LTGFFFRAGELDSVQGKTLLEFVRSCSIHLVVDSVSSSVWLPFTPGRVASFAHAGLWRLLIMQAAFAAVTAIVTGWCIYNKSFSTIDAAIENLPAAGEIRSAQLNWQGQSPLVLAEGSLVALTVDLDHSGSLRPPADVQVEFGRNDFRIRSLFGIVEAGYPGGWVIAFNQEELKPIWGAWRPVFLVGVIIATAGSVLMSWWLLAALYCLPVSAAGMFANRNVTPRSSWQLAGAALMPGAVVMTSAILFYGLGLVDLVGLIFLFCVHFVVGWVYLICGLLCVPSASSRAKNPFASKAS